MDTEENPSVPVAVIGSGIAGVSSAYFLFKSGIKNIVIIDPDGPLSRTSSRSAQCYRNWWLDPKISLLVNHSIKLLLEIAERSGTNPISLDRNGYLWFSKTSEHPEAHLKEFRKVEGIRTTGGIRQHIDTSTGYQRAWGDLVAGGVDPELPGVDLLVGSFAADVFPSLSKEVTSVMHTRLCGCLDALCLGNFYLKESKARVIKGEVSTIEQKRGKYSIRIAGSDQIKTVTAEKLIIAAGAWSSQMLTKMGVAMPKMENILHERMVFEDTHGLLPRDMPLLLSSDDIEYEEDKRSVGAYLRPLGQAKDVLLGWAYDAEDCDPPVWPPDLTEKQVRADRVLKAASYMVPAFAKYRNMAADDQKFLDSIQHVGGYYTQTYTKRPLIGPILELPGVFLNTAMAGMGIMASAACGELVSNWVNKDFTDDAKEYFDAFTLNALRDYMMSGQKPPDSNIR